MVYLNYFIEFLACLPPRTRQDRPIFNPAPPSSLRSFRQTQHSKPALIFSHQASGHIMDIPAKFCATQSIKTCSTNPLRRISCGLTTHIYPSLGSRDSHSLHGMLSQDPLTRQLGQLDRASPQFSNKLTTLLGEETSCKHVFNLSAQDALWLADYLDNVRTLAAPTHEPLSKAGIGSPLSHLCQFTRQTSSVSRSTLPTARPSFARPFKHPSCRHPFALYPKNSRHSRSPFRLLSLRPHVIPQTVRSLAITLSCIWPLHALTQNQNRCSLVSLLVQHSCNPGLKHKLHAQDLYTMIHLSKYISVS